MNQGGTLTLNNTTMNSNSGSIEVTSGVENYAGTLTLNYSTVSGHLGAIENYDNLYVNNSSLNGNSSLRYGSAITNWATAVVSNSTVSRNSDDSSGFGVIWNTGTLTVKNCTMFENTQGFAVISNPNAGTLNIYNSIIAGTIDPYSSDPGVDIWGPVTSAEYNIIGTTYDTNQLSATNTVGKKPLLGSLQNNGGPTLTNAVLLGSPAIEAGDPSFSDPTLPYDQRGSCFPRVVGTRIDIGAIEYRAPYSFSGFLQPVNNLPIVNLAKAGSAIPVKFSLGGNQGLTVFPADSPSSRQIACDTAAPISDVGSTITAGASSLSYGAGTGAYTYIWKTSAAWMNTCRQLIAQFNDNTTHVANFRFK